MELPASLVSFRPRLIDALRGYTRAHFGADLGAGVTVGIVALPLAMAFAIASGLKPEAGLWTAIIAGALISLLGGSMPADFFAQLRVLGENLQSVNPYLLRGGVLHIEDLQPQPAEVLARSGFLAELEAHRASPEVSV